MQTLKFPILMYGPTFIEGNIKNGYFSYRLESAVDDGLFLGMKILSSDGQTYRVTGVKKGAISFAPWRKWLNKERLFDVELILEPLGEPTIDELRKEIEDYLETHDDWVGSYMLKYENSKFLKNLRTVEELTHFDIFYDDYDPDLLD